jgi:hypothetical protein
LTFAIAPTNEEAVTKIRSLNPDNAWKSARFYGLGPSSLLRLKNAGLIVSNQAPPAQNLMWKLA